MRLWLVRHTKPVIAPGTCYGSLDLPAPPATAQDAARLAEVLPHGIGLISSPLQRCEHLAQCLRRLRADLILKIDPRLAEMHFGGWEGRTWNDIGRPAVDAWTADFATHRPGGGESAGAVLQRVGAALEEARAGGRDTAWITHAGVIRAAALWAAGTRTLGSAADWPAEAVPCGGWQVLTLA